METYKLIREVTQDECIWLKRTYVRGETVCVYDGPVKGPTYPNCVTCVDEKDMVVQLPMDALGGYIESLENKKQDGCRIGVSKIDHHMDEDHPNGINVGYEFVGWAHDMPAVGSRFTLLTTERYFSTSPIHEIIESDDTGGIFKTRNSTYKWKIMKEEETHSES